MKTIATLLGLLLTSTCFCQNTTKSEVVTTPESSRGTTTQSAAASDAVVTRTTSGSNYIYQFVSNRVVTNLEESRWESRFPIAYPEIVSIDIDPQTQGVEIILPTTHSSTDLDSMIARFGYSGYQLTNL
jgi:hypothetical protein